MSFWPDWSIMKQMTGDRVTSLDGAVVTGLG